MAKLELPMERTHTIMHKWGYTGSACIPMVLHDAYQCRQTGTWRQCDHVCFRWRPQYGLCRFQMVATKRVSHKKAQKAQRFILCILCLFVAKMIYEISDCLFVVHRSREEVCGGCVEPKDVFYFRSEDRWQGISWRRFEEEAFDFATALLSLGLKRGGSICILMGNVPEWPISDIGTIMAGGVGVGLYPTSSAEQIAYIINHSDAEFVLVDSREQLQKVLSVRDQLPKVRHIIALDTETARTM